MAIKLVNKHKEDFGIYIGRGSPYGNPFEIGKDGTRDQVIDAYKCRFLEKIANKGFRDEVLKLKDSVLGCFCRPERRCHGEVFVEYLEWGSHFRVACVGSREINDVKRKQLEEIGAYIAARNWLLASGNADGSDVAYARGANTIDPARVILYLPWEGYNKQHIVEGNRVTSVVLPEWIESAKQFHGAWDRLSQGGQKLMGRNMGIIGRADACLAVLNHNKVGGGGTGQAWRVSESRGIPRLDLAKEESAEKVKEFLCKTYEEWAAKKDLTPSEKLLD